MYILLLYTPLNSPVPPSAPYPRTLTEFPPACSFKRWHDNSPPFLTISAIHFLGWPLLGYQEAVALHDELWDSPGRRIQSRWLRYIVRFLLGYRRAFLGAASLSIAAPYQPILSPEGLTIVKRPFHALDGALAPGETPRSLLADRGAEHAAKTTVLAPAYHKSV